jgi:hypothetical protein
MNLKNIDLKPLSEAIDQFLIRHGILPNNYNGYIEGWIGQNGLKWSSYNSDNYLTKTQVQSLAEKLDKQLVKIKNEIMPEDIRVKIVFEPDRYGEGGGVIYLELHHPIRREYLMRKNWNDSITGQATAYDNEDHYKKVIKI